MNREPMSNDADLGDEELRRLAARLGSRAAARVDENAVARAVVERLRHPEVVPLLRPARRIPVWLRLAAALVLLAGAGLVVRQRGGPAEPTRFVAADLVGLETEELSELLSTLDETLGDSAVVAPGGLDGLDAEQLETVLRSLEG